MKYKIEHDSMGEVKVLSDKYWGAQTQRSLENFKIGTEKMPLEVVKAFGILKLACARANNKLNNKKMTDEKLEIIESICQEIINGELNEYFPLSVWQTGSGTQTNMNVNEVIANKGNIQKGKKLLHPNNDVNMSQSSNDTFPSAMHICSVLEIEEKLIPQIKSLITSFIKLENDNKDVIKIGRTHLQDATPLSFSQEISGWRTSLERSLEMIVSSLDSLKNIALGATAVGTGINAPKNFDKVVCNEINIITNNSFKSDVNKFHSLTSKDELVFTHGALKALSCDLMKIANDIRWLSSGPRCGLGEIKIPENEPGSSIMPGKVNPTQCEALTMVCVQVIANDTAISLAASLGNFELNVFMPVCIYNFIQSVRLLTDSIKSFNENCVKGIKVNKNKMTENLNKSLMLVTILTPAIGYEKAAIVAKKAYDENISLKESCIKLQYLTEDEFDKIFKIENMI